jgi:hypothetical protein
VIDGVDGLCVLSKMKQHLDVTRMEFLPYHYLLATVVSTHRLSLIVVVPRNQVSELTSLNFPLPHASRETKGFCGTMILRQERW